MVIKIIILLWFSGVFVVLTKGLDTFMQSTQFADGSLKLGAEQLVVNKFNKQIIVFPKFKALF